MPAKPRRGWWYAGLLVAIGTGLLGTGAAAMALAAPPSAPVSTPASAQPDNVERGRYLVALGDCAACHTQAGRPAFSGGRPLPTPYGTFYPPNITPDRATGIGNWSEADFYRALHDGIRPDGSYLYPAFPFPSFTHMTRDDVDAIWAYLRSVPAVSRPNTPNQLNWPFSMRGLMKVWRALYFTPGPLKPDPKQSAAWNRGAYLVKGVAHCGACHSPRNRLGAVIDANEFAGGTITIDGWRAPNISQNPQRGIGNWAAADVRDFLHTGHSQKGDAIGPMREVVQSGLQHLSPSDLDAVITYVQSVPSQPDIVGDAVTRFNLVMSPEGREKARKLYHAECAGCHGDDGRGKPPYPDLRGNPVVQSLDANDLILQILNGGFQATTAANPYPHSMPPFAERLNDDEIARIADYIRRSWGNDAPMVIPPQVAARR